MPEPKCHAPGCDEGIDIPAFDSVFQVEIGYCEGCADTALESNHIELRF